MITRVELDGFKNFVEFALDLQPLVVIAGPNAAGKSNFFDALRLLSKLATMELAEAFGEVRGDPLQQFTSSTPDNCVTKMRLAVEAIVPTTIRDKWGEEALLQQTHLRYEVELQRKDGPAGPRIRVAAERLIGLNRSSSEKRLDFKYSSAFRQKHLKWGARHSEYISTDNNRVSLHQDGKQGRKREYSLDEVTSTVLTAANTVTFRHAFAMRTELERIKFLQLDPDQLREPSPLSPFSSETSQTLSTTGQNLPAVLARLQAVDGGRLGKISTDLRVVVPDFRSVDVIEDKANRRLVAEASFDHGGPFHAALLSEGTLRLLALAALRWDPDHQGILCFEEPENGIHPLRMKGLLRILDGLRSHPEHGAAQLRQLLVNTHSPVLVSLVEPEALVFATTRRQFLPELKGAILSSQFMRVRDELPLSDHAGKRHSVSRGEVVKFLDSVERPSEHEARGAAEV